MGSDAHLILFGRSALEAWRTAALAEAVFLDQRDKRWERGDFSQDQLPLYAASRLLAQKRFCVFSDTRISGASSLRSQAVDAGCLSQPIQVFSPNGASKASTKLLKGHLFSCCLGKPLFVRFRPNVLLPIPELVVAQCAEGRSGFDVMEIADELSSIYSCAQDGSLLYRPSLLTRDSLEGLAAQFKGARCSSDLRFASRHMASRSRSPREKALFHLLTLPYSHGGYKLPAPALNESISLGETSQKIYRASALECDLLWRKCKIAAFYESDAHHLTPTQLAKDAKRDSALAAEGYAVLRISNQQIRNVRQMDAWASALAKKLGKEIRPSLRDYAKRQRSLRIRLRV